MLSTQYRLRLESIADDANKEQVPLEDMISAEKLAKLTFLGLKRKEIFQLSQDIEEGKTDDFLNRWVLGPLIHPITERGSLEPDEIRDWFKQDKPDDWRQRDHLISNLFK